MRLLAAIRASLVSVETDVESRAKMTSMPALALEKACKAKMSQVTFRFLRKTVFDEFVIACHRFQTSAQEKRM